MSRVSEQFVLALKEDLSVISTPLKESQRIKYTCFNVSTNFLIVGATSGSLYVFKREPCTFLQLLPNKEGSITHVAISPNEKLFAFSTVKGMVCVLERNVGPGARLIQSSREHLNAEVTDMKWNTEGNELYVGDNAGRISVVNIILFTAKHMFNTPQFMLMHLDSRVVQLDWFGCLLLVSTLTRCYLCNTHKEEYLQIGSKLRDGEYGASFLSSEAEAVVNSSAFREKRGMFSSLGFDQNFSDHEGFKGVKIFCARPGSRVWEVGVDGSVKNTHEFKHALATKPSKIINHSETMLDSILGETNWQAQSLNFPKLFTLSNRFLFTFKSEGFYIFDPIKSDLVMWNNSFQDITDCKIVNDAIYLRLSSGKIVAISFSSVEKFLINAYLCKDYELCSDICFKYQSYLVSEVANCSRLHLLIDLHEKLPASSSAKISSFIEALSKCYVIEKQKSQRLKSGIFLVGNFHSLFLKKDRQEPVLRSPSEETNTRKRSASLSLLSEVSSVSKSPLRKSWSCSDLARISAHLKSKNAVAESVKFNSAFPGASARLEPNDFFNSELDMMLPFTIINPPEAIQALKHIGSSVSGKITSGTKTLKDTWHVLEDKMKNLALENQPETLGAKSRDSYVSPNLQPIPLNAFTRDDIVHSKPNGVSKKVPYPKLDTSKTVDLCIDLEHCYLSGEDVTYQVFQFFDSVSTICKEYDSSPTTERSVDSVYFSGAVKTFPFTYYFPIQCHIIRELLRKSFESNLIIEWYKSRSLETVTTQLKSSEYLQSVHSSASLNIDTFLSNILQVFSELLDVEAILSEIKKTTEVPCYYLVLCTVLNLLEDGALNVSKSDGDGRWPLPLQLNAMFCVLRMGQPETCSKMGESVALKDVLYLVLRLQSRLEDAGTEREHAVTSCRKYFLSYIDNISDDAILEAALVDNELSRYIVEGFEYLNSLSLPDQSCYCGFPLPRAAVQIAHFPRIGEVICNFLWSTDQKELCRISSLVPGMWCYILKSRRKENLSNILPLIVQAGAISELEFLLPTFDERLWERAMNLLVKYKAGRCLNCDRNISDLENLSSISWTELGLLLVRSLGAANAIQLLLKFESHIGPGELDASFYRSCLLSRVVERYVPGLGSEAVGSFNTDNLSESDFLPCANLPLKTQGLSRPMSVNGGPDVGKTEVSKPWGVCLNLAEDVCSSCCLPLRTRALLHDGGLTTFRCGHSYHSVCMKARAEFGCFRCTAT